MAAWPRSSPYHFARQLGKATGLPPSSRVILCCAERAKQLVQTGCDFSLVEVATHAGFSDPSQFSYHFKRLIGVTPRQFQRPARIA